MVERSWEYYRKEEERNKERRWKEISRKLILLFGISCNESMCNIDPENEFKKDIGIMMDVKTRVLEFTVECRMCKGYFGPERLPEEYVSFARYYFFNENTSIMDEPAPEIKIGHDNRFQLPLSI